MIRVPVETKMAMYVVKYIASAGATNDPSEDIL